MKKLFNHTYLNLPSRIIILDKGKVLEPYEFTVFMTSFLLKFTLRKVSSKPCLKVSIA